VVKFDKWSNVQVQASLNALHKAIDRALPAHDRRADRRGDSCRDPHDTRTADSDSNEALEPVAVLEARGNLAPAPTAADLVFSPTAP
jgi:hypothetical protein